jgi:hypothetical protein
MSSLLCLFKILFKSAICSGCSGRYFQVTIAHIKLTIAGTTNATVQGSEGVERTKAAISPAVIFPRY